MHRLLCRTIVAALICTAVAQADKLIIPGAGPQDVTFTDFDGKKLLYRSRSGTANDREMERISHIAVDNEPAFNEAELFFSQDQKEKSIDGYVKTLRSTNKKWLKAYAARRLMVALAGSNRFDAKLVAYLAILTTTPEAAAELKPQLPERGSKFLDAAVADIERALKQTDLAGDQQIALFNFLLEVHRQRQDEPATVATLERIEKLASSLGDVPGVKAQLASVKVSQARAALDQKKYDDAAKMINDNRAFITDPREQSDALFILAEANRATTPKGNVDGLKNVALMYMRVVAHFSDVEGKPNVLASLQATASVLEEAGDKNGAAAAIEQIITTFPDDPAAAKAKQDLAQLKPAQ
jgi:hypothetical protein